MYKCYICGTSYPETETHCPNPYCPGKKVAIFGSREKFIEDNAEEINRLRAEYLKKSTELSVKVILWENDNGMAREEKTYPISIGRLGDICGGDVKWLSEQFYSVSEGIVPKLETELCVNTGGKTDTRVVSVPNPGSSEYLTLGVSVSPSYVVSLTVKNSSGKITRSEEVPLFK